jgi:hypothetical protein
MKTSNKVLAVRAHKEENFGLMGLVKYINKTKEPYCIATLAEYKVKQSEVTIDMLKKGAKPESFFTHNKAGEITGDKKLFSLSWALSAIKATKNQ